MSSVRLVRSPTGFRQLNDTQYQVTVTPPGFGSGTVIVKVGVGAYHDKAGNANTESSITHQGYQYDTDAPTMTISGLGVDDHFVEATTLYFTASEAIKNFDITDIRVGGGVRDVVVSKFQRIDDSHYSALFTPVIQDTYMREGPDYFFVAVDSGSFVDFSFNSNVKGVEFLNQKLLRSDLPIIDLGGDGQLIGGWNQPGTNRNYYYWDKNKDLYTNDGMSHDALDSLFNGGVDTVDGQYSAVINGVTVHINGILDPGQASYAGDEIASGGLRFDPKVDFWTSTWFNSRPGGSGGFPVDDSHRYIDVDYAAPSASVPVGNAGPFQRFDLDEYFHDVVLMVLS